MRHEMNGNLLNTNIADHQQRYNYLCQLHLSDERWPRIGITDTRQEKEHEA